jgi:hypothetical protein
VQRIATAASFGMLFFSPAPCFSALRAFECCFAFVLVLAAAASAGFQWRMSERAGLAIAHSVWSRLFCIPHRQPSVLASCGACYMSGGVCLPGTLRGELLFAGMR